MSLIAGAYSAVYGGYHLGLIEDGITLRWRKKGEKILTDVTGDALTDGVYRGVEMSVSFTLSEWNKAGAQKAFWPFASTLGQIGSLGRLYTTIAAPLVLTSCGIATSPTTITFHEALLSDDFDVETIFANRHRKVPIQMDIIPVTVDASSSTNSCLEMKLFTAT